jgi:hypothetical protein
VEEEFSMPGPPSATPTPSHPPRSLSVKQPEQAAAPSDGQRRAAVDRRARERDRRAQAHQRELVSVWLRDLVRSQ